MWAGSVSCSAANCRTRLDGLRSASCMNSEGSSIVASACCIRPGSLQRSAIRSSAVRSVVWAQTVAKSTSPASICPTSRASAARSRAAESGTAAAATAALRAVDAGGAVGMADGAAGFRKRRENKLIESSWNWWRGGWRPGAHYSQPLRSFTANRPSPFRATEKPARLRRWVTSPATSRPRAILLGVPV